MVINKVSISCQTLILTGGDSGLKSERTYVTCDSNLRCIT